MTNLSSLLYTPEQVRDIDRVAISVLGIPGYELMCRAGQAVFEVATGRFPAARRWLVLCGAGNNAGDGYVIARLARTAGIEVTVAALSDPQRLRGDARLAWEDYRKYGGEVVQFSEALCAGADLLIDALLGTGLDRALDGACRHAVESLDAAAAPVIAVDIPSGLCGRTGAVLGAAVEADVTVTFIGRKIGLYLGAGPHHAGEVVFAGLGVPLEQAARAAPLARIVGTEDLLRGLPRRARAAHKGSFGHVLVIGGNEGMGGAVRLAAEAALRSGAGLVSVATRAANVGALIAARPELMCRGVEGPDDLAGLLARATVVAIGPGLGQDEWARALLAAVLGAAQPLVVDADALNLLAETGHRRDDWILTPHPGEAARLLGTTIAQVQADRLESLQALGRRYGAAVLLKGRCTLIGQGGELPYLVDAGNPGMATAGMGDVLTGMVAGILAQQPASDLLLAGACAAHIHARTADELARSGGERGLLAGDLLPRLRPWLNPSR